MTGMSTLLRALALAIVLAGCAEAQQTPEPQPHFDLRPWRGRDPSEPFRQGPPKAGPEVTLPPQTVEEKLLASGIRIMLVRREDFPLVHIALVLRRGLSDAAPGVVRRFVRMGSSRLPGWRVRIEPEATVIFGAIPPGQLPSAFPFAAWLMREPVVSEKAFAVESTKARDREGGALGVDVARLIEIASRRIYPKGHRYFDPGHPDTDLVDAVTLQQVRDFARTQVAPDQLAVVAVGAIDMPQLSDLVEAAFRGWTTTATGRQPLSPVAAPLPPTAAIAIVNRPTLTQSEIVIAAPGPSALTEDFAVLEVVSSVLCGGALTSRINAVLREELGYTYQALSRVDGRLGPGPFLLEQAVAKEATAESLREVMRQIERMRREDVSEDELAVAKARIQSSILFSYDSMEATFEALVRMGGLGAPADWSIRHMAAIRNVTAKSVREAAAHYLAADRLRVVVAGDPAALRKPLAESGLGSVEVLDGD